MALLTVAGMIGAGKTSVTDLLAEELGFTPHYENVDNNDILPLFYSASEEDKEAMRYPFLLQLEFLNSRFTNIKRALLTDHAILDRSIYEDWYFAKVNRELGSIREIEFKLYEKLLNNMMEELQELPKKSPDLLIYLQISFEKTLERIGVRGREYEQDPKLYEYYYKLWSGYDDWVSMHYDYSEVIVINMDELDVINSKEDAATVVKIVEDKLIERGLVV